MTTYVWGYLSWGHLLYRLPRCNYRCWEHPTWWLRDTTLKINENWFKQYGSPGWVNWCCVFCTWTQFNSRLWLGEEKKCNHKFDPIWTVNTNTILKPHIYELEFPNRRVEEYWINSILKNLYEQVNDNGWDMNVLKEITDICSNPDVDISKMRRLYGGSQYNQETAN